MSDRAISCLIYGPAGSGKTTAATTAPKPLLLFDVEQAARFVKGKKIKWDPMTQAPPVDDGTWEICVVNVDKWDKAEKGYEWLKSRNHPFKSVVVDSISELQSKASESIKGRQQFQTQDWGKLLSRMSYFCRDLRDLTGDDLQQIEAVIITAMARDYDGVTKPYLQGQIQSQAPYWFDITGYLYAEPVQDASGATVDARRLLIGNHPNYEAKSRVPGLPPVLAEPNFVDLLNSIFGIEEVAQAPQAELPATPAPEPVAELPEAPKQADPFDLPATIS